MTNTIHPVALFRLSVLGPLTSRDYLGHGELKAMLAQLATQPYNIPGTRRRFLSEKTIEAWYYEWKRDGVDALTPKPRKDRGSCKLNTHLQAIILQAKRDNPSRSLDELIRLLEVEGIVSIGQLKRSTVHRLLKRYGLSKPAATDGQPIERRSYEARTAGDIWYGDVMHGPKVTINNQLRKTYLVSLMDDASRLICHSAFCPGETALDIEHVLKQALLKRGLPKRLVIDNGAAYRAASLQGICARLNIRLIYCRPYEPEGKGKLERWHRVVRQQFVTELHSGHLQNLDTLNQALWAWVDRVYHLREHSVLATTPLKRWQQDIEKMRSLGPFAHQIDALFYHRHLRKVRKDGTVSMGGQLFEVDYLLAGRKVQLVVDPQTQTVVGVESPEGDSLGLATLLDKLGNCHRQRQRATEDKQTDDNNTAQMFNAIDTLITNKPL